MLVINNNPGKVIMKSPNTLEQNLHNIKKIAQKI